MKLLPKTIQKILFLIVTMTCCSVYAVSSSHQKLSLKGQNFFSLQNSSPFFPSCLFSLSPPVFPSSRNSSSYSISQHWISSIRIYSEEPIDSLTIELENGSCWLVNPADVHILKSYRSEWRQGDMLSIYPYPHKGTYSYYLQNESKGRSYIRVKLIAGSFEQGNYAWKVTGFDFDNNDVMIGVASTGYQMCFQVSPEETEKFKKWGINNSIIIGKNHVSPFWWFSCLGEDSYDYILINIQHNHFVPARILK